MIKRICVRKQGEKEKKNFLTGSRKPNRTESTPHRPVKVCIMRNLEMTVKNWVYERNTHIRECIREKKFANIIKHSEI